MVSLDSVVGVAIIALGIVLSPGPNMVYLVSRSLAQGRTAGLVSLAGVGLGLVCYMVAAAFGLGKLFEHVPAAYGVIKTLGALYLGYLGWQMVSSRTSPFQPAKQPNHYSRGKLFGMGLLTNLLNPKIALLYAALIPQFIDPEQGSIMSQFFSLGAVQIAIALTVNALIVLTASKVATTLSAHPRAMKFQRWLFGSLLGLCAGKLLLSEQSALPSK